MIALISYMGTFSKVLAKTSSPDSIISLKSLALIHFPTIKIWKGEIRFKNMNTKKYITLTIALFFAGIGANAQIWKFDALYGTASKGLGASYNSTELGVRFQNEIRKNDLCIGLVGVNVFGQPDDEKSRLLRLGNMSLLNKSANISYYTTETTGAGISIGSNREKMLGSVTLFSGLFVNNVLQTHKTYKRTMHLIKENPMVAITDQLVRKRINFSPTVSGRFGVVFKAGPHWQFVPEVMSDLSMEITDGRTGLNMTVRPAFMLAYQR